MNISGPAKDALSLPNGARFYRCALQVNPFAYLQRYDKENSFTNEQEYNLAIIQACKELSIEVISIMDHQRANSGERLAQEASAAGLIVFPGAELETKEGAHILCLFDPQVPFTKIAGILGDCGIHDQNNPPTAIKYDIHELISESHKFECLIVAAHIASEKGLLKVLENQARAKIWKDQLLLACSLPGPVSDAPENIRPILENKNAEYRRDRSIALLNAQDVSCPEDLAKPGTTCWIKMSCVSIEGLRQAFLDPTSRIRLASDPAPEEHSELISLSWQGGFLDGAGIHLNDNLNVFIGGRGTGKSTAVESIRYVLGLNPLGEEAKSSHDGIVRSVLKSGTKISLLVCVHRPTKSYYLIERTIPNPPVVRDEGGRVLTLKPIDVIQNVEIYGQHEISELSKSPERRTKLLDRFVEYDPGLTKRKSDLQLQLEQSRIAILALLREKNQIEERLNQLPSLETTLARYQKAGLEDKLKERSLVVKEESVINNVIEKVNQYRHILTQLQKLVPVDRSFLSIKVIDELPGKTILKKYDTALNTLSNAIESIVVSYKSAIDKIDVDINTATTEWNVRKQTIIATYEEILRELQKSKVDGAEFIRLRQQIEELKPLKDRLVVITSDLSDKEKERHSLLVNWDDAKATSFRQLEKAAKKVSRKLDGRVLAEVVFAGNRDLLLTFLEQKLGGRLAETKVVLKQITDFSISTFVESCRQGKEILAKTYSIPLSQAERITNLSKDILLELEEIDLPATTSIKLNVASEDQTPQWQTLEELSTGQKATALLLLLLLESQAPLVVDQPEDDLDNRFITEGIVPKMKEEKRRRQFIFATHNANIPVLGDAELIVGLSASGDAEQGKAKISDRHMGSIDTLAVRQLVEEVLEGGKDAFEMRRLKYGF